MAEAVKAYEASLEALGEEDSPATHKLLENATHQMETLNAWDYELRIRQILSRLNIHNLTQKTGSLSGGQKKRVALAKVLIEEPDLLLIDEPTNHLDLEMTEWLEEYLSRQSMALLLVTHDRYFLDRVANEIMELENGQLYRYKGNYSLFLEKKADREENFIKDVDKSKNLLRKELEWMRRQPKARGTKSKSRIEAFYDLEDKAGQKLSTQNLELNVKMTRLGGKILELEHLNKRFGEKIIIDDFSYLFQKKERIGIAGINGVGKTTFLEVITGKAEADSGKISTGETVVFGYYTQAGIKLPDDKRVIEVVTEIAEFISTGSGDNVSASQFLQQFGFEPARQYTYVSKLSGGEKRRLYLLTILIKNPNFLILDEPTNDLDILTLQTLEAFLMEFSGCLIIVSHDRYFMDKVADHLFIFEGDGKIKDYNGSYSEYRADLIEEEKETKANKANPPYAGTNTTEPAKRKLSFKEKKEYEDMEALIAKLEVKKTELEATMAKGEGSHEDFLNWGKELQKIQAELDSSTDRWLELAEFI